MAEAVRYFDEGDGDGTIVYVIPVIGRSTAGMVEQIDAVIKEQTGMDVKVLPSCTARVIERDGEPVITAEKKKEPAKEEKKELPEAEAPAHTIEEQAYRERLPQIVEEEIKKDPIEAYKKYSKMIRDGKTRDPRIISRLTLLYRAEVLIADINNLDEFFKTFETQLLHEMPEYRTHCEATGRGQSQADMIAYLRRKYWYDRQAQAEAQRLIAETPPDMVKVLLDEDGTLHVANLLKGLDMTSGLPFID